MLDAVNEYCDQLLNLTTAVPPRLYRTWSLAKISGSVVLVMNVLSVGHNRPDRRVLAHVLLHQSAL